jgi:hypothetical protein
MKPKARKCSRSAALNTGDETDEEEVIPKQVKVPAAPRQNMPY